jgi:hypothetical protein
VVLPDLWRPIAFAQPYFAILMGAAAIGRWHHRRYGARCRLAVVAEGTDFLSRQPILPESPVADNVEWRLELPWFLRIQAWARCHFAADLFADRDSHRLPVFFFAAICADAAGLPGCVANS